jgi:starch synthase
LVKTGGLGDVSGALPHALAAEGMDARILLPGYTEVLDRCKGAATLATVDVLGHTVRLLDARHPAGAPLIVADCPALYARGGGPYQADDGDDWDDNATRFGVLSRTAALLASGASPLAWRPHVLHCNDWPTALAPLYLRRLPEPRAAAVMTIHNLAFMGTFPYEEIEDLDIPEESRGIEGMEFHGKASFLKAGIVYADAVTTVSPTYAREIQGPELGFGLEGVLAARAASLHGVLNGIDTAVWNPQTDPHLAARYGMLTLERKIANKRLLRRKLELEGADDLPLFGCVTRITHQKGVDLIAKAIPELAKLPAQLVVVGTGDREMTAQLRAAQAHAPGSVGLFFAFDEILAHQVEGGADAFLMPSRFEPCGMNQMYSQRYGTPPIANATGGLVDTIVDDDGVALDATGFLIKEPTVEALVEGMRRAVRAYRDPQHWRRLQSRGMQRDFGWGPAARAYARIYAGIRSTS